jgi:hypothetical protein
MEPFSLSNNNTAHLNFTGTKIFVVAGLAARKNKSASLDTELSQDNERLSKT